MWLQLKLYKNVFRIETQLLILFITFWNHLASTIFQADFNDLLYI